MMVGVGIAAVLATAVVLRLMSGPVDLELLRPYFPNEFDTPEGRMRIRAEHIHVDWSGLSQPIRLVFNGVHVRNVDTGQEIATAPSFALSFDSRSAMQGKLLPIAVVVDRPTLDAEIAREGGMLRRIFASNDSNSQEEFVGLLIDQLLEEHNYHSLLGMLDTVQVVNAHVSLRDMSTGIVWMAPNANARLSRDKVGVAISASARFKSPTTGEPIGVSLSGTYGRDRSRISVEAGIDGFKPSMLADLSPDAALLRGVDIALAGRVRLSASGSGDIQSVAVEITGGAGTVILPGILPVPHKVQSVNALAHVDAASHTARIDHIDVDLGGVKISFTGTGLRTEVGQSFIGRAEIKQIPVDRLGDYWPLEFAQGARAWALANLSGGTVDVASEFSVSTPGNDLERITVDRAAAFLDYRGMTVHYMSHMPELQNVSGKGRFEGDALRFDVAGGTAVGLAVAGATIEMKGVTGPPPQYATLHVPIKGQAPAVVAFLARPRLGLPRDVLYDPKRLGGDVAIDLSLGFPLLNAVALADIDIKAEAAISAFSLKDAIGTVDLSDAVGRIVYAGSQLNVTGTGKLDGNAVDIVWREQFGPRAAYRQRYELKGTIPASLIAKAGFPSPEPYVSGPIGVQNLSYQVALNGTSELQGRFDFKGAKLAIAPLGWSKEPGTEGQATLGLKLAAGGKLSSADMDGRGGGLAAKGQLGFGSDGSVQQISFSQLALGRTDIAVDWRRGANGVEIAVRGRALEWAHVRQALKARDDSASSAPGGAAATARENTSFTFRLDRLLLEHGSLGYLNGRLDLSGERVTAADLGIGGGKGGTFRVASAGGIRSLNVYVADFGSLLQEAGWLDGLVGGYLDIRGQYNDAVAGAPLAGTLKLGPYRLERVSPRQNVGSLNSAIDALNRAGNALQQFNGLEAKVTKAGDRIELRDGHTSGNSIGLTTSGTIDLAQSEAHLQGVIVPGFALNNLLSNVPLLGPLLTGGQNGGVFAIAYRLDGPFDDLKTDINMMSAMTPGALRELLTGSVGNGSPARIEPPAQRAP